jgi:hypothetical protein
LFFSMAATAGLIACFASGLQAAWSTDPLVNNPVVAIASDQYPIQSIPDGFGGVITVWVDYGAGSGDVYVQRLDASGNQLWGPGGVAVITTPDDQDEPAIATDGSGGVIVVWRGSGAHLYAQRVTASGSLLWPSAGVPVCTAIGSQRSAQIVTDGSGGAIIVWDDQYGRLFLGGSDLFAQRLDGSGTPQWTIDGIPVCEATGNQHNPYLVSDGSGGAIVAWSDQRGGGSIFAQRLDGSGASLWTLDGISLSQSGASMGVIGGVISPDGAGGALLAWRWGSSLFTTDIYAQRLTPSGGFLWGSLGVAVCTAANSQSFPSIVADGSGGAVISWEDGRSGAPTFDVDIYAQRVDASGTPMWTPDGVALRAGGNNGWSKLTTDGAGGGIVTWLDYRSGPEDVYAQRVSGTGVPLWAINGIPVSTAVGSQDYQIDLVSDGLGGAIASWEDYRSGGEVDIYAQRIDGSGIIGDPPAPAFGTIAGTVTASCPAPGTPLLGVTVDAFETGSGDLIATAVTGPGGSYEMEDLPAGDYTVAIVVPLGYTTATSEQGLTLGGGETIGASFALGCVTPSGEPAGSGFWKHQFGVATGGNGVAQIGPVALCSYLDLIEQHFNNNALNQVVVYDPMDGATCAQKLEIARSLLNLQGSVATIRRARQHLLSLLLNVASNRLSLQGTASLDGATVSQAITYCDQLIDNPAGNHTLAATIADKINSGQQVAAGVIPLSTANIAYARGVLVEFSAGRNPASGPRTFQFARSAPANVDLSIYDVHGRRVAQVFSGQLGGGRQSLSWKGTDSRGQVVGRGVYYSRLTVGAQAHVAKLVQSAP